MTKNAAEMFSYLDKFTIRKMQDTLTRDIDTIPDSLQAWMAHYLRLIIYEFLACHTYHFVDALS